MKAVIIYQDFASAMKANMNLQKLKLSPDFKIDWEVIPWRMEMLRFPPTATEALITATDAHLLLFAGGLHESIPFWLIDWLQEWAATRQVKEAALAITCAADGSAPTTAALSMLRRFAKKHDLTFIIEPSVSAITAMNPSSMGAPFTQSHRHWGINE